MTMESSDELVLLTDFPWLDCILRVWHTVPSHMVLLGQSLSRTANLSPPKLRSLWQLVQLRPVFGFFAQDLPRFGSSLAMQRTRPTLPQDLLWLPLWFFFAVGIPLHLVSRDYIDHIDSLFI